MFESAVHNNDDLNDVDKFNYLRSFLKCTAYEAISGLTLLSANYREAIDVLHKRFGDKQLIISKHMETLLSIEAVMSEQNVRGLCQLHDDVESHIRGLKSLRVALESYGALLSLVLLKKLPPELHLIVSRKVTDSTLNVDSLLKTVEDKLIARRAHNPVQTPHCQNQDKSCPTTTTLFAGTQPSTSGLTCCYSANPLLNQLHFSAQHQRTKADPQNKWSLFQLPQEGSHWS